MSHPLLEPPRRLRAAPFLLGVASFASTLAAGSLFLLRDLPVSAPFLAATVAAIVFGASARGRRPLTIALPWLTLPVLAFVAMESWLSSHNARPHEGVVVVAAGLGASCWALLLVPVFVAARVLRRQRSLDAPERVAAPLAGWIALLSLVALRLSSAPPRDFNFGHGGYTWVALALCFACSAWLALGALLRDSRALALLTATGEGRAPGLSLLPPESTPASEPAPSLFSGCPEEHSLVASTPSRGPYGERARVALARAPSKLEAARSVVHGRRRWLGLALAVDAAALLLLGAWTAQHGRPLRDITRVETAGDYACAVLRDGGLACWGRVPGMGHRDLAHPALLPSGDGVRWLALNSEQGCAQDRRGVVRCWGEGETWARGAPREVEALRGSVELSLGYETLCGLDATGAVRCLELIAPERPAFPLLEAPERAGLRRHGLTRDWILERDEATHRDSVRALPTARRNARGSYSMEGFGSLRRHPRRVELPAPARQLVPSPESQPPLVLFEDGRLAQATDPLTFLDTGGVPARALAGDGAVYALLSNGSVLDLSPVGRRRELALGLAQLSASDGQLCGARPDGTAVCMGANRHLQLGDGTRMDREGAVLVRR